ncbi:MAG: nucleotide sugar dehydrogenase [Christensenellaceae bacterium]|nr:nucleotide sugar dehydrogenase [Christensenellaceae bacterium]
MKITVVGIGYVGLSMAVLLAQNNDVIALDILQDRVNQLNNKISPLKDKELQEYLSKKKLSLTATTDEKAAFTNAEFIILALPTNFDEKKDKYDITTIEKVITTISKYNKDAVIVIKSTVGIGYTRRAIRLSGNKNIIFSPEFLREGKGLYDNLHPSRIIVGYDAKDEFVAKQSVKFANLLVAAALDKDVKVKFMSADEAEAVKLFSNTYLAMRVAYFNELDTYAENYGLDTKNIIMGVCDDMRVGAHYNNPSFGYGGYCLPKDTKQLRHNFREIKSDLIGAIVNANVTRKEYIADTAFKLAKAKTKTAPVIGIYKLAMKADSDNFRSSAIQDVMQKLCEKGAKVVIYEPTISESEFHGFPVIHDLAEFKTKSCVILTNRKSNELADVDEKVYTRDIFTRD